MSDTDHVVTKEEWDIFVGEDYYDTVMRIKRTEEKLTELDKQITQIRKDLVELELKISDIVLFIKQIKAGNR